MKDLKSIMLYLLMIITVAGTSAWIFTKIATYGN